MLINIEPRYEKGRGLEQNTDKPLKRYKLAAEQGDVAAKEKLIELKKTC